MWIHRCGKVTNELWWVDPNSRMQKVFLSEVKCGVRWWMIGLLRSLSCSLWSTNHRSLMSPVWIYTGISRPAKDSSYLNSTSVYSRGWDVSVSTEQVSQTGGHTQYNTWNPVDFKIKHHNITVCEGETQVRWRSDRTRVMDEETLMLSCTSCK